MALSRRKFTKEVKVAALQRLDGGASVAEVARAFEVNPNLLHRWRKEFVMARATHFREPASGAGMFVSKNATSPVAEQDSQKNTPCCFDDSTANRALQNLFFITSSQPSSPTTKEAIPMTTTTPTAIAMAWWTSDVSGRGFDHMPTNCRNASAIERQ